MRTTRTEKRITTVKGETWSLRSNINAQQSPTTLIDTLMPMYIVLLKIMPKRKLKNFLLHCIYIIILSICKPDRELKNTIRISKIIHIFPHLADAAICPSWLNLWRYICWTFYFVQYSKFSRCVKFEASHKIHSILEGCWKPPFSLIDLSDTSYSTLQNKAQSLDIFYKYIYISF